MAITEEITLLQWKALFPDNDLFILEHNKSLEDHLRKRKNDKWFKKIIMASENEAFCLLFVLVAIALSSESV